VITEDSEVQELAKAYGMND